MDWPSFIQSPKRQEWLLWAAGIVCLAFVLYAVSTTPPALKYYNVPKFSDPAATAYAVKVAAFCKLYIVAADEARRGRTGKKRDLEARFAELQAGALPVANRLRPEEARKFTEFISRCGQTLVDADMR